MVDAGARADARPAPEDVDAASQQPTPDAAAQQPDARLPDAATPDAALPDAAVAGCTALPQTGSITISGATTAASPKWLRPIATTCPATADSSVGTAVPRMEHVLCNLGATAKSYDIAMNGVDEDATLTHPDPYLVIYNGMSIPTDTHMCAVGDDDGTSGSISVGALVANFSVAAGARIDLVATGFENTDLGTYRLVITAR